MEIRHLRLIDAVAKNGTLSKAGGQLHLSQSALSHQLKELEKEMGTDMFHRINRKLVLSSAGKIMLDSAQKVLMELEEAKQKVKKELCGDSGTIRLSTHCYTCYHWLTRLIKTFLSQQQKIEIQIRPDYTLNPLPGLLENKIDLVITNLFFDHPVISYKELFWDQQLAVVGEDHPWAAKPYITAEDFASENLILYYGPLEDTTLYSKVLAPKNITPKSVIEMQLTEAAIEMILNGMGVKVMAAWAIKPYLKYQPLKAIPIGPNGLFRPWFLAYHAKNGWKNYYDVFKCHLVESMRLN